jgi:plastocyanin
MKRRIVLSTLVLGVGAALLTVPTMVAAAAPTASVTIRHQVRGCHTWSVNGGPFAASHAVTLARGASIRFTNNDVMPHQLVKVSGPRVQMRNGTTMPMGMGMHRAAAPGVMSHMGATTTVSFSRSGTYVFKTKAGEDYMPGFKTVGEDNVLRLTVHMK